MKTSKETNFPLANALSEKLAPYIDDICTGNQSELLDLVTPTTAELLTHWFHPDHCAFRTSNFHKGQRDAIFAFIYAHEVLKPKRLVDLYEAIASDALLEEGKLGEVTGNHQQHPKYAAKMATGTGKTWVLNALS